MHEIRTPGHGQPHRDELHLGGSLQGRMTGSWAGHVTVTKTRLLSSVPFCPFSFWVPLLKPNRRKKGALIIKGRLRNLEED